MEYPYDWYPYKKRRDTERGHIVRSHVMIEAVTGGMHLQAKEY